MIEAPRPSTLGEILDRTAHLYRTRFLVFLGIASLPAGVILGCALGVFLFIAWIGTRAQASPDPVVGAMALLFLATGALIFLPLCAAAMGLGTAALNYAAATAFRNENITIRDAYKAAWKRGWVYIWLYVLEALIIFVGPLVVSMILFGIAGVAEALNGKPSDQAAAGIAFLLLVVLGGLTAYGIWMLLRLCIAFPVCVVEEVSAWAAVKRATSLSKGTRGRILVLYLLGGVVRWGLSMVLAVPAILIVALIPGLDTPQHAQIIGTVMLLVIYGGSFVVRAFTKPVYVIAELLFYYDQRIRKEGFDIEWMMRQAGMVEAPAPQPQAAPWLPALPGISRAPEPAAPLEPAPVAGYSEVSEQPPVPAPQAPALGTAADLEPVIGTVQSGEPA